MDLGIVAQAVTAVVVSIFGLVKAIQGVVALFKRR